MVGVAASSFTKSVWRSIRGSLGRFLAITGIVAMGCGFLAGLQMSGRDMRLAADRWFDGCNIYDLRMVSTKGFSEKDVERVSSTEGVTAVMPASSADVMARIGNEQMAVRISSLDVDTAQEATSASDETIESSDNSYLNRDAGHRLPTSACSTVTRPRLDSRLATRSRSSTGWTTLTARLRHAPSP